MSPRRKTPEPRIEIVMDAPEGVPPGPFRTSADVAAYWRTRIPKALEQEVFAVLLLTSKHRAKASRIISVGSLTASIVHPREVFAPAIEHRAAAVILVHSHPSGDPAPSAEDIEITRRLREVGELIGIRVLDHVILGDGKHFSFCDAGHW